MRLLFLGPPGAGKGTQAKRVSAARMIPHISTGDMLRQAVAEGSDLGKQAGALMERGDLVPDDLVIQMLLARIARPDAQNGFILDGFPRTIPQAEALEGSLGVGGLDAVVVIDVPGDEVVRRISGRRVCRQGHVFHVDDALSERGDICDRCGECLFQRDDDQEETVRNRIDVYRAQTEPLIDFYGERGTVLHVVSGLGSLDDVTDAILQVV